MKNWHRKLAQLVKNSKTLIELSLKLKVVEHKENVKMLERICNKIFQLEKVPSEFLFVWGWGVFAVREQAISTTQEVFKCVVL